MERRVLGDIAEIVTDSRDISLAKGQEYKIPITVKDVEGYTAIYNANKRELTISGICGQIPGPGVSKSYQLNVFSTQIVY